MRDTTDPSSFRALIHRLFPTAAALTLLIVAPRVARAQELAPAAGAAATGPTAGAAPASSFGDDGAWVLSMQSYNPGAATSAFDLVKQSSGGTSVLIQPAVDYFLAGGVSVGGTVGVGHASGATTVNVGARAGFNQPFAERGSFWPTVGIDGSFRSGDTSSSTATLVVFAPFLYHAAPHFFLGAGPFLAYLVKGGPDTQYGLDFVLGGWL